MAFVLVAGASHVTHTMAANAPLHHDNHGGADHDLPVECTGDDHPSHGDGHMGPGHCPACALGKTLAFAPPPIEPALVRRTVVDAPTPLPPATARHALRREITARPRAPPAPPMSPSRSG